MKVLKNVSVFASVMSHPKGQVYLVIFAGRGGMILAAA